LINIPPRQQTTHPTPSNHATLSIPATPCKSRILISSIRLYYAVVVQFRSMPAGFELAAVKWPWQIRWHTEEWCWTSQKVKYSL